MHTSQFVIIYYIIVPSQQCHQTVIQYGCQIIQLRHSLLPENSCGLENSEFPEDMKPSYGIGKGRGCCSLNSSMVLYRPSDLHKPQQERGHNNNKTVLLQYYYFLTSSYPLPITCIWELENLLILVNLL